MGINVANSPVATKRILQIKFELSEVISHFVQMRAGSVYDNRHRSAVCWFKNYFPSSILRRCDIVNNCTKGVILEFGIFLKIVHHMFHHANTIYGQNIVVQGQNTVMIREADRVCSCLQIRLQLLSSSVTSRFSICWSISITRPHQKFTRTYHAIADLLIEWGHQLVF